MNLVERDGLIISKLAATGLTGAQAVNEVIRQLGQNFCGVPGGDQDGGLVSDVTGIQQAVTDLATPTNRAAATALLAATAGPAGSSNARIVPIPKPAAVASTDHYRMRALAAGA